MSDEKEKPVAAGDVMEYTQYAIEAERTLYTMQKKLANSFDYKTNALAVMRAAAEFYDADWCGILDVDYEVGVWAPMWWHNRRHGDMAQTSFKEFELSDDLDRWVNCLREHEPVIIPDVEAEKELYPAEYRLYQRVKAKSVLALPFWKGPHGFLVLRNPKRYNKFIGFLRSLNFVIVSLLTEYYQTESSKLSITSPRIKSDKDVYITLFGELTITTEKGVLTEREINAPKIVKLLVYLLLNNRVGVSPRIIAEALWPDDDVECSVKNMKNSVYRLQQMFSLLSDYRLVESTAGGYRINPQLNVFTDYQLFDEKWNVAVNSANSYVKIERLKKAVDLYNGHLFQTARNEHWIMPTAVAYENRYLGAVSELMKILEVEKDYTCIQYYAAKALQIAPHSIDIYFWMLVAMHRSNHCEMAWSEMRTAQANLLEEEYQELLDRLGAYGFC